MKFYITLPQRHPSLRAHAHNSYGDGSFFCCRTSRAEQPQPAISLAAISISYDDCKRTDIVLIDHSAAHCDILSLITP